MSIWVLLFVDLCGLLPLLITFSGLAKVAIFTTNVSAENQCLINHKCVCGALNRHFCQTRVMRSPNYWSQVSPYEIKIQTSVRQLGKWLVHHKNSGQL
jgi:hypothetical protein